MNSVIMVRVWGQVQQNWKEGERFSPNGAMGTPMEYPMIKDHADLQLVTFGPDEKGNTYTCPYPNCEVCQVDDVKIGQYPKGGPHIVDMSRVPKVLTVGMKLKSPVTGEVYEVTALGKRYLLVEVKTKHSSHEFPRRYHEVKNYEVVE
jgi:hypothetical protein